MLWSQLDVSNWPECLNKQIAMFRVLPSEIHAFSGIEFQQSFDSLDEFEGAVLRIGDKLAALIHYQNAPVLGTVLVVPEDVGAKEKECLLSDVMTLTGLSEEQIIWRPIS
jgi:hypothetical protein